MVRTIGEGRGKKMGGGTAAHLFPLLTPNAAHTIPQGAKRRSGISSVYTKITRKLLELSLRSKLLMENYTVN
jgi:hypothetical protein